MIWRRLRQWLKRAPTAKQLRRKALERLRKGNARSALPLLEKALAMEPSNIEGRLHMGVALYLLGRYREAETHFRFVVALDPNNAHALLNLAATYDAQGRVDDALPLLRKVAQLFPEVPDVHYNLAVALAKKGDRKGAIAALRQELERHPDHFHALRLLRALREENSR